jgi:undecaprenyl-diphosphatase
VIQCGTLVAVLAYFRGDIARIARAWSSELWRGMLWQSLDARMGWMMILATVPIVAAGLLFKDHIESDFRSLHVVAAALVVFSLLLVVAEAVVRMREKTGEHGKPMDQVGWGDALAVGIAQAFALIPGASRSGVTISAGLFRGMTRATAARFSFLLSLPAILAAALHELYSKWDVLLGSRSQAENLAACTVASAVVGYAAIAFLLRYLRTHTTYAFIAYRLVLAAALVALVASGRIPAEAGTASPPAVNASPAAASR